MLDPITPDRRPHDEAGRAPPPPGDWQFTQTRRPSVGPTPPASDESYNAGPAKDATVINPDISVGDSILAGALSDRPSDTVGGATSLGSGQFVSEFGGGRAPTIEGYELFEELGRGGMGVVYKARQTALNRVVALKIVAAGKIAQNEIDRFRQEAEAVARLRHPNVVQVFGAGEVGGRLYYSLEFAAQGSLAGRIGGKPLPPREAAEILEKLARAMHYCHRQGIIHRDLKPANVLITDDGEVKIADFGLAKQLNSRDARTLAGSILGTPNYMAPEQAAGKLTSIGPCTDVYALGVILYEALVGRPPYRARSFVELMELIQSTSPEKPRALQAKTPRDLETICLRCLEKEPAKRYPTALALAEDLRRFLDGEPIEARRQGLIEKAFRACARRPLLTASIGLGVSLAAVVALSLAGWALIHARTLAEQAHEQAIRDTAAANQRAATVATRAAELEARVQQLEAEVSRLKGGM